MDTRELISQAADADVEYGIMKVYVLNDRDQLVPASVIEVVTQRDSEGDTFILVVRTL